MVWDKGDSGFHNADLAASGGRLIKGGSYRDLSTVMVIPTRGLIPAKVCTALWNLITPMNGKFYRFTVEGDEVGRAYNSAVEEVLAHPELGKWKYFLTVEEDNLPPPDGLLKLYEGMEEYDAVGGLYWTKGDGGQPMIYGNPKEMPKNFKPQVPIANALQPCNGLGMGFTLFKISMFRKLKKLGVTDFFRTVQQYVPGVGTTMLTQDLYFFEQAGRYGFKFASDNRVLVGHLDVNTGEVW